MHFFSVTACFWDDVDERRKKKDFFLYAVLYRNIKQNKLTERTKSTQENETLRGKKHHISAILYFYVRMYHS